MSPELAVRPIAIVGPTGTGKSDLGLELAVRLGGEVVNADAMQLYRGMDIGTAKLPPAQRRGVPHHLLDVLEVTEAASVAAYQRAARGVIERLLVAGRVPLLVGGSGLYVRAVLDELEFPGTDPQVRGRLEAELAALGPTALHERLAAIDPAAASAVSARNGRRIVRALEVIEITGRAFPARLPREPTARHNTVLIGLDTGVPELDKRLGRRVGQMFAGGLVDEVARLTELGLRDGRTAPRALGYQQVLAMFDGRCDEAAAVADTITATRRFVRRQRSWFRADPRIHWLDAADPDLASAALQVSSSAP